MKKTLAVVLSVIMLACCLPFSVNAADVVLPTDFTFSSSNELESGNAYVYNGVGTLTIPADTTVYVPAGASLTINTGAKLSVEGSLIVLGTLVLARDAILECYGSITVQGIFNIHGIVTVGSENITTVGTGSALVDVKFPTADEMALKGLTGKIKYYYAISKQTDDLGKAEISTGADYKDWIEVVDSANRTVTCDINHYLFIRVEILEEKEDKTDPDYGYDKYDDSKMYVYINGAEFGNGGTDVTKVGITTTMNVSFRTWNENDLLNEFKIHLPSGDGYAVYGRDGEQSAVGETVKLKYGQKFSFRVELEPEYDMSQIEVYVYDAYGWLSLKPDENLSNLGPSASDKYGYYTIESVKSDTHVKVEGVVANETILMVGNILDLVKNIFDMISGFFQEIFAFLGIGGATA